MMTTIMIIFMKMIMAWPIIDGDEEKQEHTESQTDSDRKIYKKKFVHLLLSFSSSAAAAVTRFYTLKSTNSFLHLFAFMYVCFEKNTSSFWYMLRSFEIK